MIYNFHRLISFCKNLQFKKSIILLFGIIWISLSFTLIIFGLSRSSIENEEINISETGIVELCNITDILKDKYYFYPIKFPYKNTYQKIDDHNFKYDIADIVNCWSNNFENDNIIIWKRTNFSSSTIVEIVLGFLFIVVSPYIIFIINNIFDKDNYYMIIPTKI